MERTIVISTSDFRRGSTKILWKGAPCLVLEYHHVKPGKGGAFLRTKLRNLKTGSTTEETFRSGEKFPEPDLEHRQVQFLYADNLYHFMDQESFEQIDFNEGQIETVKKYLKEGINYEVLNFDGTPLTIEAPNFMILAIKETVPGVRGDTAQGGSKAATLESGAVVQVPLFVNEGDKVKVDTREDKYIERV